MRHRLAAAQPAEPGIRILERLALCHDFYILEKIAKLSRLFFFRLVSEANELAADAARQHSLFFVSEQTRRPIW